MDDFTSLTQVYGLIVIGLAYLKNKHAMHYVILLISMISDVSGSLYSKTIFKASEEEDCHKIGWSSITVF